MNKFKKIFKNNKPVIGMIHLPHLLGYSRFKGMDFVVGKALSDLKALKRGGIDGIMIENEYDHPHQIEPGPEVLACFTKVVEEVIKKTNLPVGLEVLLNHPKASMAIAKVTGAQFIRTDFFVDKAKTKHGVMEIDPRGLIAFQKKIKAQKVAIFTDIQVKYSELLVPKKIEKSAEEAIRYGSDALIITGEFTGDEPDLEDLVIVKKEVGKFPVLIGSGFNQDNAQKLLKWTDGAIVGTALMKDRKVDWKKARELMRAVRKVRI